MSWAMRPNRDSFALVQAAFHRHDDVVFELVALLDECPREHGHLDRRLEVFEDEHRHLVTLLGELARQIRDHATHFHLGAVLHLGQIDESVLDLPLEGRLDAEQRVV